MARHVAAVVAPCLAVACHVAPVRRVPRVGPAADVRLVSEHRGDDDLLTAGLGLDGLRSTTPPAFADAEKPTPVELRRRAIWASWRGIADLRPGGFGEAYGNAAAVPGREYAALVTLPGANQPHRVVVQVPDGFDHAKRCLLVAPASGSRGVYGAIAVAGAWGLPRGCAVAYTDKGAGSDYFDEDSHTGVLLDGTRGSPADGALAFAPGEAGSGVAIKHAHSRDNPESDWGKHVLHAAEIALTTLSAAFPEAYPFDVESTRVIAVGISNGGGAVLRAAEADGPWLDGVVAGEPNVYASGGRPLYHYATQAALFMPCALLHLPASTAPRGPHEAVWAARCASLAEAGLIQGADVATRARSAYEHLRGAGFSETSIAAGVPEVTFDLWRAIAVTYASAYSRTRSGEHPCNYGFAVLGQDGAPRPATAVERAAWFADASGIPPGAGVTIVDGRASGPDPSFPGLVCLSALKTSPQVEAGITATRAASPRPGLPVIVVHGTDDGLILPAFSSDPYVEASKTLGRVVRRWRVEHAQHFDAFLALPGFERYVPLLPHVYAALDRLWGHLEGRESLPGDALR